MLLLNAFDVLHSSLENDTRVRVEMGRGAENNFIFHIVKRFLIYLKIIMKSAFANTRELSTQMLHETTPNRMEAGACLSVRYDCATAAAPNSFASNQFSNLIISWSVLVYSVNNPVIVLCIYSATIERKSETVSRRLGCWKFPSICASFFSLWLPLSLTQIVVFRNFWFGVLLLIGEIKHSRGWTEGRRLARARDKSRLCLDWWHDSGSRAVRHSLQQCYSTSWLHAGSTNVAQRNRSVRAQQQFQ